MTKKTPSAIIANKNSFVNSSLDSLTKSYSEAETFLLNKILQDVLPELSIVDGKILNTQENINILTSKLNVVFIDLRTGPNRDIVNNIIKDFSSIRKLNSDYFSLTGDLAGEKFVSATKRVEDLVQKSIGFNPDKTIRPNSFIDSVSNNDAINQRVRELAIRNIQGGNSFKDFTAELSDAIKTNENGLGVLNKHYNQVVGDRYAQYDRAQSVAFADELEMQAFIYSGGTVDDTRKFCCQRNGLVFTRDEAQVWSGLNWTGKNSGYVPLIDMGGYNCRHSPQWISTKEALRRRPDLTLNKEGKLVPKKGVSKQRLNDCR